MEKVRTRQITKIQATHEFYCDECGKFIGEAIEFDDGYVPTLGRCEWKANIGTWYRLKRNLCDGCKDIVEKRIVKALENIGFIKE